jgi:L,D-transpeptidase catalytic domain
MSKKPSAAKISEAGVRSLPPTGNFIIFGKDIDHHSRSFRSVVDASGRVINSNATPGSHVPRGGHFRPAPMPYYMEFSPAVGMHGGYLPGYPASHGCVRMPRGLAARFFMRVHMEHQSWSLAARTICLACGRINWLVDRQ